MTESAFILLHQQLVNPNQRIHLNVTAIEPSPQGRVTSMVIGRQAALINGETSDTDLNNVLEQVEQIRFTFSLPDPNDDIEVEVEITNSAYYSSPNQYFYFQFEPFIIPDVSITELFEYQQVQVTFTPYLLDIQFGFSEYNALFGNAQENRKSTYIVESNRVEDSVLPTNWEAIISGSAAPATIQDSLYEDSGWIRGRYDGTKIRSTGNAGITPAINGTPFQGEIFSNDADNSYICSTNREQIVVEDLLHTSTTPLPRFVTSSLGTTLDTIIFSGTNPIQLTTAPETGSIEVGNIISIINSDPNVGPGYELLLVTSYDGSTSVGVERGYAGTVATSHALNAPVNIVQPFDIFKFEENRTQYLRLVNDAKIYILGNNTIIDTDKYGNVIDEFQCEYIEYIVTD